MKRLVVPILLLAFGFGGGWWSGRHRQLTAVPEPPSLKLSAAGNGPAPAIAARNRLFNADVYISGPMDDDDKVIYNDLVAILDSDTSRETFREMVVSSHWPAVLYGLIGTYYCDPFRYRAAVEEVIKRAGETMVTIQTGGDTPLEYQVPVMQFLKQDGAALLEFGESIPEYRCRKHVSINDVKSDFYGGGSPVEWMDRSLSGYLNRTIPTNLDLAEIGGVSIFTFRYLENKAEFNRRWAEWANRAWDREREEENHAAEDRER